MTKSSDPDTDRKRQAVEAIRRLQGSKSTLPVDPRGDQQRRLNDRAATRSLAKQVAVLQLHRWRGSPPDVPLPSELDDLRRGGRPLDDLTPADLADTYTNRTRP